jgi:hypothetical protein
MDLREVTPGFPTADEIPNDIDVHRLIAKFNDYAEAIAIVIEVE